jgi:hypothetical protein
VAIPNTQARVWIYQGAYRGLKRNHKWLCAAFAAVNIYQHRRRLAKINLQMAPQRAQCPRRRPREPPAGKMASRIAAKSTVLERMRRDNRRADL